MTGIYSPGWLDGGTAMTDHNNYAVTELFYRGWIHMVPRQCQVASAAVNEMTNWLSDWSLADRGMERRFALRPPGSDGLNKLAT